MRGSARIAATARAVELVCHQLPVPGEKGIRLGHASDLLEGFTAESFGDLGQGGSTIMRNDTGPVGGVQVSQG